MKRPVADLSFDKHILHILSEIVQEKFEASPLSCARGVDAERVRSESQPGEPAGVDLTAPVWLSQVPGRSGGASVADGGS